MSFQQPMQYNQGFYPVGADPRNAYAEGQALVLYNPMGMFGPAAGMGMAVVPYQVRARPNSLRTLTPYFHAPVGRRSACGCHSATGLLRCLPRRLASRRTPNPRWRRSFAPRRSQGMMMPGMPGYNMFAPGLPPKPMPNISYVQEDPLKAMFPAKKLKDDPLNEIGDMLFSDM